MRRARTASRAARLAALGTLACVLTACALGPDFARPPTPAVDRYDAEAQPAATPAADGVAQRFSTATPLPADWWRLFQSPPLDAAVRTALANSPTLQAAQASLRASQDNLRAGDAVFWPRLDAQVAGERTRPEPSPASRTPSGVYNVMTASGTISYPLDLFGGERRAVEALGAQVDQQRFAGKAAYLALSANVVDACIARAAYAAQARATRELVALEQQQLAAIEAAADAGVGPWSAVLAQHSLIAANEAQLAPLEQRLRQADHLLALLEGTTPAQASLPDIDLARLALPTDLPLALPSDLVRQRPDILVAEAQLHAASAAIGVATAAEFPGFELTASYGSAAPSLGKLVSSPLPFWSVGPSLTAPLFHGGALWWGRQAAVDNYEQAQADYRQAVLVAFDQVADVLQALAHDAQALQAQQDARAAAAGSLALLQANLRAGLVAEVDVLAADVQLHEATIATLQAVAQRQQDTVALFAALGGGWWNDEARAAGAPAAEATTAAATGGATP